jgi:hypothetical protein
MKTQKTRGNLKAMFGNIIFDKLLLQKTKHGKNTKKLQNQKVLENFFK